MDSLGMTPQSSLFQGFTLFNPTITTPLPLETPPWGPHCQTKPSIPKPKLHNGTKAPMVKKQKSAPTINVVDLTGDLL